MKLAWDFWSIAVIVTMASAGYADCTQTATMLVPSQRTAYVQGAVVYDTSTGGLKACDGTNYNAVGGGASISGNGTANYGAVWSGASTLVTDSALYVDTTNHRIGIGTTSPNAQLDVLGTISATTVSSPNYYGQYTSFTTIYNPGSFSGNTIAANNVSSTFVSVTTLRFSDGTSQITAGTNGVQTKTLAQRNAMTPTAGTVIYNSSNNRLEWYNGSSWYYANATSTISSNLFASCKAILDAGSSTGDGSYTIDPAGNGTGFSVYCDMTTNGGGWTLVDNDASTSVNMSSRTAGANNNIATTKGSLLPAYTWSASPQLMVKSSYYNGSLNWVTFNVLSAQALLYPTAITSMAGSAGDFSVNTLNGNTNQGALAYIYSSGGYFIWIGGGSQPTAACNYANGVQATGLGQYTTSLTATCSTWVR